jgi:hypothetical protein
MVFASLVGVSLIVSVALDTGDMPAAGAIWLQPSVHQKEAALLPLVRTATECIARTVTADPRFRTREQDKNIGELIVASMPSCVAPVRAMIDAYDRYYGDGTGEAFFMGPYLDILPTAVNKWGVDSPE